MPLLDQKPRPRSKCLLEDSFCQRCTAVSNASPADGFPIALGNRVVEKGVSEVMGGHKGHPKQTRGTACDSRGRPQGCSQRAPSAGDRRQACRARCLSCCIPQGGGCCALTFPGSPPMDSSRGLPTAFSHTSPPQSQSHHFPTTIHPSHFSVAPTLSLPASLLARLLDATSRTNLPETSSFSQHPHCLLQGLVTPEHTFAPESRL